MPGPGLIFGKDPNGILRPIFCDTSGRILPIGRTAGGVYVPLQVDADGNLVVAGIDTGGDPQPLATDTGGRLIPVGQDAATAYHPFRLDADGRVVVAGEDSGGNPRALLTDATGAQIAGSLGWISGAWQKNPLQLGWGGTVKQVVTNLSAAAGTNILYTTSVPAGEIHIYEAVAASNVNSSPSAIGINIYDGSNFYPIAFTLTPAASQWVCLTIEVSVPPTYKLAAVFTGCTLNDDLYFQVYGRRIDTDQ